MVIGDCMAGRAGPAGAARAGDSCGNQRTQDLGGTTMRVLSDAHPSASRAWTAPHVQFHFNYKQYIVKVYKIYNETRAKP